MNQAERNQVAEALLATALYYSRELRKDVLAMMLDDLDELSSMAVLRALNTYRRDPKNRTFPLPAQLRAIVAPAVDPESAAREIAARISAAVPKFGWNNREDARKYIGEAGWQVVERQGGWAYICEHLGLRIDPTAFQAQVREQAKAQLQHSPEAMAKAIGLGGRSSTGELQSAREIVAVLTGNTEVSK